MCVRVCVRVCVCVRAHTYLQSSIINVVQILTHSALYRRSTYHSADMHRCTRFLNFQLVTACSMIEEWTVYLTCLVVRRISRLSICVFDTEPPEEPTNPNNYLVKYCTYIS